MILRQLVAKAGNEAVLILSDNWVTKLVTQSPGRGVGPGGVWRGAGPARAQILARIKKSGETNNLYGLDLFRASPASHAMSQPVAICECKK